MNDLPSSVSSIEKHKLIKSDDDDGEDGEDGDNDSNSDKLSTNAHKKILPISNQQSINKTITSSSTSSSSPSSSRLPTQPLTRPRRVNALLPPIKKDSSIFHHEQFQSLKHKFNHNKGGGRGSTLATTPQDSNNNEQTYNNPTTHSPLHHTYITDVLSCDIMVLRDMKPDQTRDVNISLALTDFSREMYDTAIERLSRTTLSKRKPNSFLPHFIRGVCQFFLEKYLEAKRDFTICCTCEKFDRDAYDRALSFFNRSLVWIRLNQIPKAMDDVNEAIRIYGEEKTFYASRALLHRRRGHFEAAQKDYEMIRALEEDRKENSFSSNNVGDNTGIADNTLVSSTNIETNNTVTTLTKGLGNIPEKGKKNFSKIPKLIHVACIVKGKNRTISLFNSQSKSTLPVNLNSTFSVHNNKVAFLKSFGFLSHWKDPDIHQLAHNCRDKSYRRGEILMKQNDTASALFFVKTGMISLIRSIQVPTDNQSKTIKICVSKLGSGSVLGESTILADEKEETLITTSVLSDTLSVCLTLERDQIITDKWDSETKIKLVAERIPIVDDKTLLKRYFEKKKLKSRYQQMIPLRKPY